MDARNPSKRPATRAALLLAPLVALSACDGRDVDFGGRDLGPELFAIHTEDGSVRAALTDTHLVFALSDRLRHDVRGEVRSEMRGEPAGDDDQAATDTARDRVSDDRINRFVERTMDRALSFRTAYPLDEIRDIRWEDGEMKVEFTTRRRSIDRTFRVNNEPVTRAFSESAVRELSEEFRALKR